MSMNLDGGALFETYWSIETEPESPHLIGQYYLPRGERHVIVIQRNLQCNRIPIYNVQCPTCQHRVRFTRVHSWKELELYKEGSYYSDFFAQKYLWHLLHQPISTAKYAFPPHHSILQMSSDTKTIKPLFKSYESALHNSSTAEVLPLYALSGIFMTQHFPTAAGTSAIKAAYNKVFEMIVVAPPFPVHENEIFNEEWAFVRTSSAGSTEVKATGEMVKEANQELFVLQKIDGEWKIARYCFCTVLPPGEA